MLDFFDYWIMFFGRRRKKVDGSSLLFSEVIAQDRIAAEQKDIQISKVSTMRKLEWVVIWKNFSFLEYQILSLIVMLRPPFVWRSKLRSTSRVYYPLALQKRRMMCTCTSCRASIPLKVWGMGKFLKMQKNNTKFWMSNMKKKRE